MYILVGAPVGKEYDWLPRRPSIIASSEDRSKLILEARGFLFGNAETLDTLSFFKNENWSYTILIVPTAI